MSGEAGGSSTSCAVAIISKLPRLGRSKTRLARTLGQPHALALHRAFLADEIDQLDSPARWRLHLVHDAPETDDERAELKALLGERAVGLVPGGSGLAAELLAAFETLLAQFDRAVIVSGDVPHLEADEVARALDALDDADLVLGAGPDGGYHLVGLRAPHDVFTAVPMGEAGVVQATIARARTLGLRVAMAATMTDLDEAQDLLCLAHGPSHVAPHTRRAVAAVERSEIALQLPTELQIEVTSRCNLPCSACLRTHTELAPDADLTLGDFRQIVAELPRLERVAFQLNGEPLLCADLFAMIGEARARGAHTIVNTNAVALDARRAAAVIDSGLDELRVSLDGARAETVRQMAGADTLEVVVRNVRAFIAARGAEDRPRVSLWMIATRANIGELPDLVILAADLCVEEVYVQRLVLTGHGIARREHSLFGRIDASARQAIAEAEVRAARTGVALRASGRRSVIESLTPSDDINPWLACWRPWRTAVVTASKKILPCCISSFTQSYAALELGDLTAESWGDLWNGTRYRAIRRGLLQGEPRPACARCTRDWSL